MKRYLKTYEEVIDALKAGKVIRDKDSQWTLRDGFIIRKDANYASWVINDCISSNYTDIYVDEPEPLKIEVGKFYKTRDCRKAIVLGECLNLKNPFMVSIIGSISPAYYVSENGEDFDGKSSLDLVAPWEE